MNAFNILALLACAGLLGCSTPAQNADTEFFETFVSVVVAKDYDRLQEYVSPKEKFFENGKLFPHIERFLYDGYRPSLSLVSIAQSGAHDIKIERQPNGSITFYWIPKESAAEAKDIGFFQDEWMKKYFACEFERVGNSYKLTYNICFAETGGPHHRPYG